MKFHHLFLVPAFFLAACTPSTQLPTATPVPTSTLTPIPTATQTATSTPEAWVAIAEEYGMPEEQAQKLEGLDVTFEVITEGVDGVLVKEGGADAFYFDRQTEFLVAVDRWNQVTSAEQLSENPVTGEELLSDEWFAWTKYLLSKTGDGVGPNTTMAPGVVERGEMLSFALSDEVSYLINYPGLSNHGVTYADVTATVRGEERRYQAVVNGYEDGDQKKHPLSLLSRYAPDYMEPEKIVEHNRRFGSMMRSPIITSTIDSHEEKDPFVSRTYQKLSWVAAMDLLQHGNPSEASGPGAVYLTFIGESNLFGN